jgi:hypothetical protein
MPMTGYTLFWYWIKVGHDLVSYFQAHLQMSAR